MVALQVQGFYWILVIFLAPIIPRIGLYGLKYKAFSIIQCTLIKNPKQSLSSNKDIWIFLPKPLGASGDTFGMLFRSRHL